MDRGQGNLAKARPQRIGRNVSHNDGPTPKGRCAARANGGPNLDAVNGLVIGSRQAWSGPVTKALALLIELQDRAEDPRDLLFNHPANGLQDVQQRGAFGDQLQKALLRFEQRL